VVSFRLLGRDCSGNAFSGPNAGILSRYGIGLLLVPVGALASVFIVTSGSTFSGTAAGFCFWLGKQAVFSSGASTSSAFEAAL